MTRIPFPGEGEFHSFYLPYLKAVEGADAVTLLEGQLSELMRDLAGASEERALARYAPGKWSVKEVVGHLVDSERVLAYRMLRIGRGDQTPMPGFDENRYVAEGNFDAHPLGELIEELASVRAATRSLVAHLDPVTLARTGEANGAPFSVQALIWIIVGHFEHHRAILRERYGFGGAVED